MLQRPQIENWANQVIERVARGQQREDTFVELKHEWPKDHDKIARRLAAHANAARGEPILWLIGLDEEHGVIGAAREELANWYPQVAKYFHGPTPGFRDVAITLDNGLVIVALQFETEQPPYMFRVPGSAAYLEVPWREGTRPRSATRAELLSILLPLQLLPDIEVIAGGFDIQKQDAAVIANMSSDKLMWTLNLGIYVSVRGNNQVIIPFHRCAGSVSSQNRPSGRPLRFCDQIAGTDL